MGRPCGSEEWTCKSHNGECIPLSWVCDDHEDCDDKSDEKDCSKFSINKKKYLQLSVYIDANNNKSICYGAIGSILLPTFVLLYR